MTFDIKNRESLDARTLEAWENEAYKTGEPEDDLGMNVYWRERFLDLISEVRDWKNVAKAEHDHNEELTLRLKSAEEALIKFAVDPHGAGVDERFDKARAHFEKFKE